MLAHRLMPHVVLKYLYKVQPGGNYHIFTGDACLNTPVFFVHHFFQKLMITVSLCCRYVEQEMQISYIQLFLLVFHQDSLSGTQARTLAFLMITLLVLQEFKIVLCLLFLHCMTISQHISHSTRNNVGALFFWYFSMFARSSTQASLTMFPCDNR